MRRLIVLISVGILFLISLTIFFSIRTEKRSIKSIPTSIPTVTPTLTITQLNVYKIYDLINDYRDSKGLKKLMFDPSMCEFTKVRLSQIRSDWSHNGFKPQVEKAYYYTSAAENLGRGFDNEEELIQEWTKSPEHLKNIVDSRYTRTCIAADNIYQDIYYRNYIVQEFASW